MTKLNLPTGVERSEKLYSGADFVIRHKVLVAKSVSLSQLQVSQLRHRRAELDDRHSCSGAVCNEINRLLFH